MDLTADQTTARWRLDLANRHVAEGGRRVKRQAALTVSSSETGTIRIQAKELLEQLRITLALQIEDRDRILQELGKRN